MMAQWTDSSRTMLIQQYQSRPILWDRRVNDLNSRVSKADALSTVTSLLNEAFCPLVTKRQYTVDDVKQQWKNLKDTFVRKQRWVNEGKYSRDPQEEPSWKFYRLLKFLDCSDESSSPGSPATLSNSGLCDKPSTPLPSTSSASLSPSAGNSNEMPEGGMAATLSPSLHSHPHSHFHALQRLPPSSHRLPIQALDAELLKSLLKQQQSVSTGMKQEIATISHESTTSSEQMMSLLASLHASTSLPQSTVSLQRPLDSEDDDTNTSISPSSSSSAEKEKSSFESSLRPLPACSSHSTASLAPLLLPPPSHSSASSSLFSDSRPSMSVESALRLSSSPLEPPAKKRKSYESRIASLVAANMSTLSSAASPSLVSPRDVPSAYRLPDVPLTPLSAGPLLTPTTPSGELDEFAHFGAMVSANLKRMATDHSRAAALRLQKSISDIIFEANIQMLPK